MQGLGLNWAGYYIWATEFEILVQVRDEASLVG